MESISNAYYVMDHEISMLNILWLDYPRWYYVHMSRLAYFNDPSSSSYWTHLPCGWTLQDDWCHLHINCV